MKFSQFFCVRVYCEIFSRDHSDSLSSDVRVFFGYWKETQIWVNFLICVAPKNCTGLRHVSHLGWWPSSFANKREKDRFHFDAERAKQSMFVYSMQRCRCCRDFHGSRRVIPLMTSSLEKETAIASWSTVQSFVRACRQIHHIGN